MNYKLKYGLWIIGTLILFNEIRNVGLEVRGLLGFITPYFFAIVCLIGGYMRIVYPNKLFINKENKK